MDWCRGGLLEPILVHTGQRQTVDSPAHTRTQTHVTVTLTPRGQLESPADLNVHVFRLWEETGIPIKIWRVHVNSTQIHQDTVTTAESNFSSWKLGWPELMYIDCIPQSRQVWERTYIYSPTKSMAAQYWEIAFGEGLSLIRILSSAQPCHFQSVLYWLTDCMSARPLKYRRISQRMDVTLLKLKQITEQTMTINHGSSEKKWHQMCISFYICWFRFKHIVTSIIT